MCNCYDCKNVKFNINQDMVYECERGNLNKVKNLFKFIKENDQYWNVHFMYSAINFNNFDIAKFLLSNLKIYSNSKHLIMQSAVDNERVNIVKYLLKLNYPIIDKKNHICAIYRSLVNNYDYIIFRNLMLHLKKKNILFDCMCCSHLSSYVSDNFHLNLIFENTSDCSYIIELYDRCKYSTNSKHTRFQYISKMTKNVEKIHLHLSKKKIII